MLTAPSSTSSSAQVGMSIAVVSGVGLFFQAFLHPINNANAAGNQLYFSTIFNTQNSTYETLGVNSDVLYKGVGNISKSVKKQIRKDLKRIKAEDK